MAEEIKETMEEMEENEEVIVETKPGFFEKAKNVRPVRFVRRHAKGFKAGAIATAAVAGVGLAAAFLAGKELDMAAENPLEGVAESIEGAMENVSGDNS